MKHLFLSTLFFILFVNNTVYCQSDSNPNSQYLGTTSGLYILNSASKEKIKTVFLFKDFNHQTIIYDDSNKQFKLNNFNIDLVNNSFVSKVNKDTLFTFTSIPKVIVNNREFVKKDNFIHEKFVEGKKIDFYRKFFSVKKEQSFDKMTGKLIKPEHYVEKRSYLLIDNLKKKTMYFSKLNKKKILKFLNESDRNKVISYSKKEKLSFKKAVDLKKILNYYNSI